MTFALFVHVRDLRAKQGSVLLVDMISRSYQILAPLLSLTSTKEDQLKENWGTMLLRWITVINCYTGGNDYETKKNNNKNKNVLSSSSLLFPSRVGDVLESINGIDLQNADHSTAVQAVKESKGLLDMVSRRLVIIH